MEATYINTGHPDFISGHKAMAIVSDRMAASKPQQSGQIDPKTGKLAPGTLNNGRDLESDLVKKDEGFFGSFWPGGKKPVPGKKVASAMEAVSLLLPSAHRSNDVALRRVLISVCIIATYGFASFWNAVGARDYGN